jgi:hypothetical protein
MIRVSLIAILACLFGYFSRDIMEARGSITLGFLALTFVWFDVVFIMLYKKRRKKYRCR